jgi:hypothetical protein
VGSLKYFPGLIKKIIENRSWEERVIRTGAVVRLRGLAELITAMPLEGWGESLDKVEALLKDDPVVLPLFRSAIHVHGGDRKSEDGINGNNITIDQRVTGTSRAYTLSRLKRESPELFEEVCEGKLSANAAAIKAGFRHKPTIHETCVKSLRRLIHDGDAACVVSMLTDDEFNALVEAREAASNARYS